MKTNTDAIKITLRCKQKDHKKTFLGWGHFWPGFPLNKSPWGWTLETSLIWHWIALFAHLDSIGEFNFLFALFDYQLCRPLFRGNPFNLKRTQEGRTVLEMLKWGKQLENVMRQDRLTWKIFSSPLTWCQLRTKLGEECTVCCKVILNGTGELRME